MLKTIVALRHVHFEDLGTFEAVLTSAGFTVHYHDIGVHEPWTLDPLAPELLVVLGGPVSAFDYEAYAFLHDELSLLEARLKAKRPTIGICLGAQLIALALGANVRPAGTKEIGFGPVVLTEQGWAGPLRHLADVPVLHWHGDMFDIPDGAARLAETPICRNQAFALGRNIMGVQFHPEADASAGFERWLVGHAVELARAGIDPRRLREDAHRFGPCLRDAGRAMFTNWLQGLEP